MTPRQALRQAIDTGKLWYAGAALLVSLVTSAATVAATLGFTRPDTPEKRLARVEATNAQQDSAIGQLRVSQADQQRQTAEGFRDFRISVDSAVANIRLLIAERCAVQRNAVAREALKCR